MKRINIVFFLFIIAILFISCKKDTITNLEGSWVETDSRTDTIIFNSNALSGTFLLHRGREIRNGHDLPKLGSGPYEYKIFDNRIDVLPGFSSALIYNTYHFKLIDAGQRFEIGVFTTFSTDKAILTFEKIDD